MVELSPRQKENLGKYFLDMSKIVAGVYVFTARDIPLLALLLGIASSLLLVTAGLKFLKEN